MVMLPHAYTVQLSFCSTVLSSRYLQSMIPQVTFFSSFVMILKLNYFHLLFKSKEKMKRKPSSGVNYFPYNHSKRSTISAAHCVIFYIHG